MRVKDLTGADYNSLTDTIELRTAGRITKINTEPTSGRKEQTRIKPISDAGVIVYAEVFGFKEEIISEDKITDELREVVSYAYMIMRKEEDKEAEEKTRISKPTWWQSKLVSQPIAIRRILGGYTEYFKPDIDGSDLKKKENRLLRVSLGMKSDASADEVYKKVLEKLENLK